LLRDYEILYIVRPELDEEKVHEAVGSVDKLIANLGGATVKTDVWGRRRLAYEVRHLREGQYVLTDFRIEPARVPEMEATLKISETVFRHLIVRKPEKMGRTARKAAAAAVAAEAAREAAAAAATDAAAAAATDAAAAETAPQESEAENKEPETVLATAAVKAEEAEEEE
jgi:small subunit ribosomal protein S6